MTLRYAAEPMTTVDSVRQAPDCGCITPDYPAEAVILDLIDDVSDALTIVSGMRSRGRQSLIARPCRDRCGYGQWHRCVCCDLDAIPLGDADPEIGSVWINGVQLDASEYALHSSITGWNLVRLRSAADIAANRRPCFWPSWQDRWRDWQSTTDIPTFAVIFTVGMHLDNIYIEEAANELICDLITNPANIAQALPAETVSADLGGVGVNLSSDRISAVTERLTRVAAGQMGPAVTRFMGIFAPAGRATPVAWAPELLGGWTLNLANYTPPVEP